MSLLNTRDLVFFDKNGAPYNFKYNEETGVLEGCVYIDPISRGLYETQTLYFMQKFPVYNDPSDPTSGVFEYKYGYPCYVQNGSSTDQYVFAWDESTNEVDEINLFEFDANTCPPEDTSSLTYMEYNCPKIEFMEKAIVENLQQQGIIVHKCAKINITFCNVDDEYNTFRRDLMLWYSNGNDMELVGVFKVYAESVEEDERLGVICNNLGYNISNEDYRWFKKTDIKEQVVDLDFMNQKRKEILMEGHNIYPYIGAYKALLNVIKYFGYDNISIKEWWKNVDYGTPQYGKYYIATSYSLENSEIIKTDNNITLPSKKFKKTNKITLAWNINRVANGEINEVSGLPEIESLYTKYSIEEAVIKLYGLKRKLEKEFLPINTHIVDIVGEAFAFDKTKAIHNVSDENTFVVKNGCSCDFSIYPEEFGYIEDLRPFGVLNDDESDAKSGEKILEDIWDRPISDYVDNTDPNNVSYNQEDAGNPEKNLNSLDGAYKKHVIGEENETSSTDFVSKKPISVYNGGLQGVYDKNNACPWNYYEYYIRKGVEEGTPGTPKRGVYYLANFSLYYPELKSNSPRANDFGYSSKRCLPDCEGIPVGCPIRLTCLGIEKQISIGEASIKWDDTCGSWISFQNTVKNHARVEWVVFKNKGDTPMYLFSLSGTFDDGYGDIGVVLPYVGTYSVEMKIYGYDNSISIKDKINCFTVYPKMVEMSGWYKSLPSLLSWEDDSCWEYSDCDWNYSVNSLNCTWDDMNGYTYETMDRANYVSWYYNDEDVDARMMLYNYDNINTLNGFELKSDWVGPYFWDNMETSWVYTTDLNWDNTVLTGDLPCYFAIGNFLQNGMSTGLGGNLLEIVDKNGNYGVYCFSQDMYIDNIVYELNNYPDPIIGKFYYRKVYVNANSNELNIPDGYVVMGISKQKGTPGDVEYVGIVGIQNQATSNDTEIVLTHENNANMRFFTKSKTYNPSWQNIQYLNNVKTLGRMTSVNLDYFCCKINGKTNPKWTVRNINDPTFKEITFNRKNFHYVFKKPGCYSVTLELDDTNGNHYIGERKMFIVK